MGLLDLLRFLGDSLKTSVPNEVQIDEDLGELANAARGETVTATVLGHNERTRYPIVEYIDTDENEQPEYVFRAGQLLVSDGQETLARKHPSQEQQVLVTDRRILFVLGNRVSDEVMDVPLESIVETYLDTDSARTYLVVDAVREGDEMTFFADVTLEANGDELRAGVEYVERWVDGAE